jgi:hypothetical protein
MDLVSAGINHPPPIAAQRPRGMILTVGHRRLPSHHPAPQLFQPIRQGCAASSLRIPGLGLTQTSFVGPEDLLLVKEVTRSRFLVRHDSNAAEASPAMRRMCIRERHDFKAFP